ncbi:hypothetical protein [Rhizobium sp. BE258]|uniref:hypothetical protein n=1 Tax=Rhizobium sp. BE258 TaxID=2817722 RepID=UPI00285DE7CE|nr:hypothetical protein [Rhizobium sp. BE258]MDR7145166.1 hypothetical protein [Rhizobium sp. BE258]
MEYVIEGTGADGALTLSRCLSPDFESLIAHHSLPLRFKNISDINGYQRPYMLSLSKWLEDGVWRNTKPVAAVVLAEALAERERINREGFNAFARVEADKRLNKEPEAADVEAVKLWNEQRARLIRKQRNDYIGLTV